MERLSNGELYLAKTISDCLQDTNHWHGRCLRSGLKKLRREKCCDKSPIQEYKCHVLIDEPGAKFACDLCLEHEIRALNFEHGIKTIGSCCGHAKQEPYIQVAPENVQRMRELGYDEIPPDEYGNGLWCFAPKTDL